MTATDPWVEVPRPSVKAVCRRCERTLPGWRRDFGIVSPYGVLHIGRDDGVTACGIDATGDRWWWPL